MKSYAVSIEVCHLTSRKEAKALAEMVRDRLDDINEDVYICVTEYEKVQKRIERSCEKDVYSGYRNSTLVPGR